MPASFSRLPYVTPFVLQLAYDVADFKLVRAHWTKNFVRKFGPAEPVHALMARVLHQIRADGYVVRECYVFPLEEVLTPRLAEATPDEQIYCALRQLMSVMFTFEMPAVEHYHVRRLLDDARQRDTGSDGVVVRLRFNPQLRDYLLNVAQLSEVLPPVPPQRGAANTTAGGPARA